MSNYYRICIKFPMLIFCSWGFFKCLKHCLKLTKIKENCSIQNLALEMQKQCVKQKKNLSIVYNHTIKGIIQRYPKERLITSSNGYFYYDKKTYGFDYLFHNLTLLKEKRHLESIFFIQDLDQEDKKVLVTIKSGLPKFQTTYEKSKFKKNKKEAKRTWLYKILFNPYIKFYKTTNSLSFNTNIFLSGNFIYNHKTGMIRCFRVKQISIKNDMHSYLDTLVSLVFLFALAWASYSWIKDVYSTIRKRLWENKQIQRCGYFCLQCKTNRSNMIAFPCGHISICKQCQADTKNCPKCRQSIEAFQLIYQV